MREIPWERMHSLPALPDQTHIQHVIYHHGENGKQSWPNKSNHWWWTWSTHGVHMHCNCYYVSSIHVTYMCALDRASNSRIGPDSAAKRETKLKGGTSTANVGVVLEKGDCNTQIFNNSCILKLFKLKQSHTRVLGWEPKAFLQNLSPHQYKIILVKKVFVKLLG